jgi:hypothetical protein
MKGANFAALLNRMGYTRAKYGGVLVKKIEHGSELSIHVVPWRDAITDQVDIKNGIKIERHFYTPADLQEMATNSGWQNIPEAIATATKSQNADITAKSKRNRTLGANIEVWEIHGVLPDCYLDEYKDVEGAENTYSRQMHIVVLDEQDKDETKGETLFSGTEPSDPYKYLAWEEIDGRGLGIGVIEDLFEAQVWTNYSVKQKKDMLDLAGRVIFQTTDGNIAAKNVLTDLEGGSIITTAPNTAITQINNSPQSLGGIAQLMEDWDTQAENITSTYPAILGSTPPHANAAFRLQASLQNEATAIFEYRRQEMGLLLQEMYKDWILPFLVKQINKTKEFVGDLTPDELQIIAATIADWETEAAKKNMTLNKQVITQPQADQLKQQIMQAHLKAGPKRKFGFPKGYFKSDYNIDVITTGEQKDQQKMLAGIFQIFGVIGQNPNILSDPRMARLFNQAIEMLGISPTLMGGLPKGASVPTTPAATMAMPPTNQTAAAPVVPSSTSAPAPAMSV